MKIMDTSGTILGTDIPGENAVVLPGHGVEDRLKEIDGKLDNLKELIELRKVAASLETRLALARKEAEDAKEKAFWASVRSWISIGTAALAAGIALLDYLWKLGVPK